MNNLSIMRDELIKIADDEQKNFFQRHKKKLVAGGAAGVALGLGGLALFRKKPKRPYPPSTHVGPHDYWPFGEGLVEPATGARSLFIRRNRGARKASIRQLKAPPRFNVTREVEISKTAPDAVDRMANQVASSIGTVKMDTLGPRPRGYNPVRKRKKP